MSIKFPRVMVSKERHAKLTKEAKAKGLTLAALAEKKFAKAR